MNESPLISVIVPVYNVEEYLTQCIESIINQTYTNLEIILVDDGSTDQSGKICDEYAIKDDRIQVIHKENRGVGSARNVGLDTSKGEYVSFVDSDDYVDKNYIKILLKQMLEHNVQVSICNLAITDKKNTTIRYKDKINGVITTDIVIKKILNFELGCSACGKLYRHDLITDIRFSDYIFGEDLEFVIKVLSMISNVFLSSRCLYYYIMNLDSIVHSGFSYSKFLSLQVFKEILEQSKDKSYYPYAISRYISSNFHILMRIDIKSNLNEYKYMCNTIKKYRKYIVLRSDISLKIRMACFLSLFSFRFVIYLFHILNIRS